MARWYTHWSHVLSVWSQHSNISICRAIRDFPLAAATAVKEHRARPSLGQSIHQPAASAHPTGDRDRPFLPDPSRAQNVFIAARAGGWWAWNITCDRGRGRERERESTQRLRLTSDVASRRSVRLPLPKVAAISIHPWVGMERGPRTRQTRS